MRVLYILMQAGCLFSSFNCVKVEVFSGKIADERRDRQMDLSIPVYLFDNSFLYNDIPTENDTAHDPIHLPRREFFLMLFSQDHAVLFKFIPLYRINSIFPYPDYRLPAATQLLQ